jgi:hypothetical protein
LLKASAISDTLRMTCLAVIRTPRTYSVIGRRTCLAILRIIIRNISAISAFSATFGHLNVLDPKPIDIPLHAFIEEEGST